MLDSSKGGGGSIDPSDASSNALVPETPQLSPSVVVIIVLITVVFFLSGFLHLIARCFAHSSRQNVAGAAGSGNNSGSLTTLQGQLQQLFHLHDAGVEQAFIDALPVFIYRTVRGLKEGADCAVCLNEFAPDDRLRLLPKCSHAFHLECIDTWLLSNSTCPLCRCSLRPDSSTSAAAAVLAGTDSFNSMSSTASFAADSVTLADQCNQQQQLEQVQDEQLVPVKLGRFCPSGTSGTAPATMTMTNGSRRSYSMGSYDYVTAGGALVVIAPTPLHRKVKPSGTPGHRSVLSESIAEESGATPWVTIDIDAAKPILPQHHHQQQSGILNWAPWKRPSTTTVDSSKSETSSLKSFSFRLPFFQDHQASSGQHAMQHPQQQHWWWKNIGPSGSQWDQGSVCSTNVDLKSVGSAASSGGSITKRTLRWLLRRDKTPRGSMEDVFGHTTN